MVVAPLATHGAYRLDDAVDVLVGAYGDIRSGDLKPLVSDGLLEELTRLDLYPLRSSYDRILSDEGIVSVAGVDVARMALYVIDRAVNAQEFVADFTTESGLAGMDEAMPAMCDCHLGLHELTVEAIASAGALALSQRCDTVLGIVTPISSPRTLELEVRFAEVLWADETVVEDQVVDLRLVLDRSATQMVLSADPGALFDEGVSRAIPATMALAVSCAARQLVTDRQVADWSFHPSFLSDLEVPALRNDPGVLRRVLRACAETLSDVNLSDAHHLRAGSGANAKQIERAKAKAWRRDVDREWHLHYWLWGGGKIQFASVRGHSYMGIPDPHRAIGE